MIVKLLGLVVLWSGMMILLERGITKRYDDGL
jgi:hypothetical protein